MYIAVSQIMKKVFGAVVLSLIILGALAGASTVKAARIPGIVILADMSHGQNPGGLQELIKIFPEGYWIVLVKSEGDEANLPDWVRANVEIRYGGFTEDTLNGVDMVIIGQPTSLPDPTEIEALANWFNDSLKALWISADSDYPAQGSELSQEFANMVLEAIGSKLRVDYVSVEDDESYAKKTYRVIGIIDPPPEVAELGFGAEKMLFHGPGAVAAVAPDGTWVNPLTNPVDGVYVVVRTSDAGRIVEHQPSEPGAPGNVGVAYTAGDTGRFPLLAVEIMENGNRVIVGGESPYSGYQAGITWEYYGIVTQGPRFCRNLLLWATQYEGELLAYKQILSSLGKIDDVANKVSSLESIVSGLQGITSRIDSLESQIGDLNSKVSSLEQNINTVGSDLTSLKDKVSSLEGAANTPLYVAIIAILLSLVAIAIPFVKKK